MAAPERIAAEDGQYGYESSNENQHCRVLTRSTGRPSLNWFTAGKPKTLGEMGDGQRRVNQDDGRRMGRAGGERLRRLPEKPRALATRTRANR